MESKSKTQVSERLECPDIDQDFTAIESNDHSTNDYDPELSDDCISELSDREKQWWQNHPLYRDDILDEDFNTPSTPILSGEDVKPVHEFGPSCSELSAERLPTDNSGSTSNPKRVRHPNCKHSMEELKKMARVLKSNVIRSRFVYFTYYCGRDPQEKLKRFLSFEEKKPRVDLRRMAKILPKKLRSEFYRAAMKRNNPLVLMKKYLSRPENQQRLCQKLELSNSRVLSMEFHQSDGEKSVTQSMTDWFSLFLQEGSIDEAVEKAKKLIKGALPGDYTSQEAPSYEASGEGRVVHPGSASKSSR